MFRSIIIKMVMEGPKSLGREWVESDVLPLVDSYNLSLEDKLATFCEHVAVQISKHIKGGKCSLQEEVL